MSYEYKQLPPPFETYNIYKDGTVQSRVTVSVLKPFLSKGYPRVELNNKGVSRKFFIHRLVAWAFVWRDSDKTEVNHIDGNKTNPHADNLEWVTQSENTIHAFKTGLMSAKGSKNTQSKLTEEKIVVIRRMYDEGLKSKGISRIYQVSEETIRKIGKRETWKHVEE